MQILKQKRKVIVIGATGFIGSRVCRKLSDNGYDVYVLARPSSDLKCVSPFIVGKMILELSDANIDQMTDQIRTWGISNIISAVGSVNYHQSFEFAYAANVDTTRSILSIAQQLQDVEHLHKIVFIGSAASRGSFEDPLLLDFPNNKGIDETVSYYRKGQSAYCDVKYASEDLIRQFIIRKKLRALIVEPGSLVGPDKGQKTTTTTGLIKKIIKGFPILNGGASYTSAEVAASGILMALQNGNIGQTYLLGGENMTMYHFAKLVRKIYKAQFPHPKSLLLPVIKMPVWMSRFIGKYNIILNSQQVLLGNSFHYINWQKAAMELDYRHTIYDLEQSIDSVLGAHI